MFSWWQAHTSFRNTWPTLLHNIAYCKFIDVWRHLFIHSSLTLWSSHIILTPWFIYIFSLPIQMLICWCAGDYCYSLTVTFPGPVASEQVQIISSPPHGMTDGWYEVLVVIRCVWFSPNMSLCMMTKDLYVTLFNTNRIVPDLLWFVQM